jgi:hypothetical protein
MGFNSKCWILQVERQKGRLTDGFSFFHKKNFFNQNKEKIEERDGRSLMKNTPAQGLKRAPQIHQVNHNDISLNEEDKLEMNTSMSMFKVKSEW